MEEEQFRQLPAEPFPSPPPFWRHFTRSNIDRLDEVLSESHETRELPLELTYLRPPPPPPTHTDSYTTFSISQSLNPTPAPPPREILLFDPKLANLNLASLLSRLTKSVLLNFLELTTILGNDPIQYEEKMSDMNRIMLNIHFVINMYRPHQMREGVKEMLEVRLEDGKREIQQSNLMKKKVEAFLRSLEQQDETQSNTRKVNSTDKLEELSYDNSESKRLWDLIHEIENN